jgi:hypothetical protein
LPGESDEYLRRVLINNDPGSPPYEKALVLLQSRDLATQGRRLARASWALTVATVMLALATLIQAYVAWEATR